jgi:hypothetical protein
VLADTAGVHEPVKEIATLEAKVLDDFRLARSPMTKGRPTWMPW